VGSRFGLSVSVPPERDPDFPASYGDPEQVVNQFVFTEGSNILFEGGHLVLGHRWADAQGQWNQKSVLNHLLAKSKDYRSFRPVLPIRGQMQSPRSYQLPGLAGPSARSERGVSPTLDQRRCAGD
jgi:hypothetical protein